MIMSYKERAKQERVIDMLTPRQTNVVDYWCQGFSNKEIANYLHLAESTVKRHGSSIFFITKMSKSEVIAVYAVEKYKQENNL